MRPDGRDDHALRPITITYEHLDRVDGSARFSSGSTSALASVSGPIEVRPNSELPSTATFEIHVRPLSGMPSPTSKHLASTIRSALLPSLLLSHHPRSLVQLVVQSLSPGLTSNLGGGGGAAPDQRAYYPALQATMLNAASAAFLSAGSVPMSGVVCAFAVGKVLSPGPVRTGVFVLDPGEDEQGKLVGGGVFAFLFSGRYGEGEGSKEGRCVWSNWSVWADEGREKDEAEEMKVAMGVAEVGAREVWKRMKESVPEMGRRAVAHGMAAKSGMGKSAGTLAPPGSTGDGEMEDEMEEVDDVDDSRMEI